jgi:site-specific DNA recombinase
VTAVRAAIYCRVSRDREGAGLAVTRQEADCRELVADRGWSVHDVYVDNDLSASVDGRRRRKRPPRPDYERLLRDVRSGVVDVVVAWHTDRLHRQPIELEEWIDACAAHSVTVYTVKAGHLDLSNPAGRMIARQLGAAARFEAEYKADRSRRKHEELATDGKASGSLRAFGHDENGKEHPTEGPIVRDLVKRLLAGESLRSLTQWLIDNEVKTVRGGQWRPVTLAGILPAARLSGQREWTPGSGQVGDRQAQGRGRGFGIIVNSSGPWAPIITPEETEQVRALLKAPSRKTTRPATYLLSGGLLVCGVCGARMNSHTDGGRKTRRYACIRKPGPRGGVGLSAPCGKVSVVAEPVDALVAARFLQALRDTDVTSSSEAAEDPAVQAVMERVEEDQKALERLTHDLYVRRIIGEPEYLSARKVLEGRINEANAVLASNARVKSRSRSVVGAEGSIIESWDEMSMDQRRTLLGAVIERVVVMPVAKEDRGRPRFDPERIKVEWAA